MAVNSSHPLTLHSRGAGKCLHSSMIVDRLGRGATTADAPMPPSVGNVILIVLDHVVGAAPGRPREKGGCKEPVPSEPLPSPSPWQLHLRVRTATLPGGVNAKWQTLWPPRQLLLCLEHSFPNQWPWPCKSHSGSISCSASSEATSHLVGPEYGLEWTALPQPNTCPWSWGPGTGDPGVCL